MTIRKKSAVKAYGGAVSRILFLVLTAALLGGCTPRNVTKGMAEGEAYDAVISVKGKQEEGAPEAEALDSDKVASEAEILDPDKADSEAETLDPDKTASDSGELLALAGLLGKTDDEAAEVFGGGEENRTEDGKALVGRSYETTLFGKACSVHTSYDDNGLVWLVLAEPRELAAQELRERICAVTGSRPEEALEKMPEETLEETLEETGESGTDSGKTSDWNWGGIGISLYEADGGVSLSLSLAE